MPGVNKLITAFGETKKLKEWEKDSRCSVSFETIYRRAFKHKWTIEKAITVGSTKKKRYQLEDFKYGIKFGYLTATGRTKNEKGKNLGECICVCGKRKYYRLSALFSGGHKSCNCKKGKGTGDGLRVHGMSRNYKGNRRHRLYGIWSNMKTRCINPKNSSYHNYGGRGILIDESFMEYNDFYEWAIQNGYRDNLTIDRINNNGNYSPSNCRWITISKQQSNKRTCIMISAFGEVKNITEWSRDSRCNVGSTTLKERIFLKRMNPEYAITLPKIVGRKK